MKMGRKTRTFQPVQKVSRPPSKNLEVAIRCHCPAEVGHVQVCRNNQSIYTIDPDGREAQLTLNLPRLLRAVILSTAKNLPLPLAGEGRGEGVKSAALRLADTRGEGK